MKNIYVFGFATFGHPNDFRQSPFLYDQVTLAKSIKIFDLTNAIKVFPDSTIYAIRKESINGLKVISYSIYTYAKEQKSTREGTFIGSSILYSNEIAEENITISKLTDFHRALVTNNTSNDILTVNHSKDFNIPKKLLSDFDKISFNLKEIENLNHLVSTNNNLVVFSRIDLNTLNANFRTSLDLLNRYDTIYFTDNKNVIEYCRQRNIYSVLDENGFDEELADLQNERKLKIDASINELENEKQKLETDRKKLNEEYESQIAQNERLHKENRIKIDESKSELSHLNLKYNGYSKKIDESINKLRSGKRPDIVKPLHSENKKIFIDSVNKQRPPVLINEVSKPKPRSEIRLSFETDQHYKGAPFKEKDRPTQKKENKIKTFKVMPIVLVLLVFLLFSAALLYLLFFRDKQIVTTESKPNISQTVVVEQTAANQLSQELSPQPNGELSKKEVRALANRIRYDIKVEEVVKIIFNNNQKDIQSSYSDQPGQYSQKLIELNKNCFMKKDSVFLFVKDSLMHIPCYKVK